VPTEAIPIRVILGTAHTTIVVPAHHRQICRSAADAHPRGDRTRHPVRKTPLHVPDMGAHIRQGLSHMLDVPTTPEEVTCSPLSGTTWLPDGPDAPLLQGILARHHPFALYERGVSYEYRCCPPVVCRLRRSGRHSPLPGVPCAVPQHPAPCRARPARVGPSAGGWPSVRASSGHQ